jgi:glycosyltransferase involved in cell wall biosynthesis
MESCYNRMKTVVNSLKGAKCKLYLAHGDISLDSPNINAYFTTNHAATFDKNVFAAILNKKPVVCSDFGGFKYLTSDEKGGNMSCRFGYELVDVPVNDKGLYGANSKWANYNEQNIAECLIDIYNNYGSYKDKAEKLYKKYADNSNLEKLYRAIMED